MENEPERIEAKNNPFEEKLRKIQDVKLTEIKETMEGLFCIYAATRSFNWFEDLLDFRDWAETVRGLPEKLEQMIKSVAGEGQQFLNFFPLKNFAVRDFFPNTIKQMESLDYTPPDDPLVILDHLWVLWTYYQKVWIYPPTLKDMALDISLCKLMGAAYLKFSVLTQRGMDLPRTKKSTAKKRSKIQKLDDDISEVFYRIDTKGMKKNKIAKVIHEKLKQKYGESVPSVKTIVRRLEVNKQFRKDLRAEGALKMD